MIRKLLEQVTEAISAPVADNDEQSREQAIRMATAVLMVDVARADHDFDEAEFDRMFGLVKSHFHLDAETASELINAASDEAEDLVSLHEFTQLLHEHLDDAEKERVISLLWQIAYADGRLDKYEESLVKKIGDLMYVNRARANRLKEEAASG